MKVVWAFSHDCHKARLGIIAAAFLFLVSNAPLMAQAVLNPGDILTATWAFPTASVIRVDPATGAQTIISSGGNFQSLSGIAIDASGSIFVTDPPQRLIIRVDPATGAQTIISSGNNLIYPTGITIDAAGNLLVADRSAHAVIRIDPNTGAQAVVSAGGNLSGVIGNGPNGIAVDAAGNLLVANSRGGFGGSVIVRVDPITGAQAVVSQGGALTGSSGIAIDVAGNLLVVSGDRIIRVDPVTGVQTIVSSGGLFIPFFGIAIDAAGSILTDTSPNPPQTGLIVRVDPITGVQTTVSSGGSLRGPAGIAIVPSQTPPSVTCNANPNTLWPPNGRPVLVTVSGSITAGTQALAGTTYAVVDEYGQVQPSGSIAVGAGGDYSLGVSLIAARNGYDRDGRTYTINVTARDQVGDVGSCSAVVTVPHNQGQ